MKRLVLSSAILLAVASMVMIFKVIIQETEESQEDLKSIMDGVKEINKQKDNLRKIQDAIDKLASARAGEGEDEPVPAGNLFDDGDDDDD